MKSKGLLLIVPLFFLNYVVTIQSELSEHYLVDFRSAYDQDLYESVLNSTLCEQQLIFLVNNTLGLQCK